MTEGKLRELCRALNIQITHKNHKGWLVGPCPYAPFLHEFGTDRNPSFNIHVNHEGYSGFKCWTCKQSGNLSKLINKLGDLREENYAKMAVGALMDETPESFEDFDAKDSYMEEVKEITALEATIYLRMYPLATEAPEAVAYLRGRGITRAAAETMDLRYDPDERRVIAPVYDWEGKLYGFNGRTVLEGRDYPSEKYPKVKDYNGLPKNDLLMGEHLAQEDRPTVVVEGLFALLHIIGLGVREYANPVATMGSHLSESQRDRLIDHDATVFMLYDWDLAGRAGLWGEEKEDGTCVGGGALDILKPHLPVYRCLYPEDVEDPDDLDAESLRAMVVGDQNEMG